MRRTFWALSAFAFACALASYALAQAPAGTPAPPPTREQGAPKFGRFGPRRPGAIQQLEANPSLVDDPKWLAAHPRIQSYLSAHPEAAKELKANPRAYLTREDVREAIWGRRGRGMRGGELHDFNMFLDAHSDIAKELKANPAMLDNKEFVEKHPPLGDFLKAHPEVSAQLKQRPHFFERRHGRRAPEQGARP